MLEKHYHTKLNWIIFIYFLAAQAVTSFNHSVVLSPDSAPKD